jgi:copper homeostasis protein
MLLEIAVHTIESAISAQNGGAARVELFSNPLEGGVTPSEGTIAAVRDKLTADLHVMIRPRGGDFYYDDAEFDAMQRDVEVAKRLGANGVVFGFVNLDGTIHEERTGRLVNLSRPLAVTFHRAFDVCQDLRTALETLISSGVDRVLTSGGEVNAVQGMDVIANLAGQAGNRIVVIAGGGIRPNNAREIVQKTGVREIHAGLRHTVPSPMRFRNEKISLVPSSYGPYQKVVVREEEVRQLVSALEGL